MVSRRSFITKSAVGAAAAIIAPSVLGRKIYTSGISPLSGKNVLFVWGGWVTNLTSAAIFLSHG
jgi:hypothetical protein